jgi:hypothetical protein
MITFKHSSSIQFVKTFLVAFATNPYKIRYKQIAKLHKQKSVCTTFSVCLSSLIPLDLMTFDYSSSRFFVTLILAATKTTTIKRR